MTDGAQYDAETGTLFCVLRDGWQDYRYAEIREDAELIRVVEGEEVELYDRLLSLALTGGDYNWI